MKNLSVIFAGFLLLTACGGSGHPAAKPTPQVSDVAPVAVITVDSTEVVAGQTVFLDGSRSSDPDEDGIATYSWTQVSGTSVEIKDADKAIALFTAPQSETEIVIQLIVTDAVGSASAPAQTTIKVHLPAPPIGGGGDSGGTGNNGGSGATPLTAVVVSNNGSDDSATQGSTQAPVKTIARAIQIARQNNLSTIYVMTGIYQESVSIPSNTSLIGGIASFSEDGTPVTGNESTLWGPPAGSSQVITIDQADGVVLKNFHLIGGDTSLAYTVKISASRNIEISGNNFKTPGAVGGLCRDIEATGSNTIKINGNHFVNGGHCNDYTAVWLEQISGITLGKDDQGAGNIFSLANGSEQYVKAVQAASSDGVTLVNTTIANGSAADILNANVIFAAFTLNDVTNLSLHDNAMTISGGSELVGASLRCSQRALDVLLEANQIHLNGAAQKVIGVRITCPVQWGNFHIAGNQIQLNAVADAVTTLTAVDVTTLLQPVTLQVTNNIFYMPNVATATTSDKSNKTGIVLSRLASNSDVTTFFNTVVLSGKEGMLSLLSSSVVELPFATAGNVVFLNGSNTNNAVFSLKADCAANHCEQQVANNLIGQRNVRLTYYNDTNTNQPISDASAQNAVKNLSDRYFDATSGELLQSYANLVNGQGPLGTGVAVDLRNNARGNPPDIGATEF